MVSRNPIREFPFVPRIINPTKIGKVVIFAAEARIRESAQILAENLPWIRAEIFTNPEAVSGHESRQVTAFVFDDTGLRLVDAGKIKARNPEAVLILLSSNAFIHRAPPQLAQKKYPYTEAADLVFAYGTTEFAPALIITSVIRVAEDLINIRKSSGVRRFIFLVVDDEPRWLSQFLPVLYNIIGQRADVMITRTYEETLRFLFGTEDESKIDSGEFGGGGHGDDVVCLIADIFFPKGEELNSQAGRDLIRLVDCHYPRIPIIVASKAKEASDFSKTAFLLPKGDPGSLQKLKDHIRDHTGIGELLVCDRAGREITRIKNIHGLYQMVVDAEKNTRQGQELRETIESYARKDKFSTWLYMHSYNELGDVLRPKRSQGRRLITILKTHLREEIRRLEATPLSIDGMKVFSLEQLLSALRTVPPEKIQPLSDNDVISSWLDRKGYSELAELLRPVHGTGWALSEVLVSIVEKWIRVYAGKNRSLER